jgi:hypothetical protein
MLNLGCLIIQIQAWALGAYGPCFGALCGACRANSSLTRGSLCKQWVSRCSRKFLLPRQLYLSRLPHVPVDISCCCCNVLMCTSAVGVATVLGLRWDRYNWQMPLVCRCSFGLPGMLHVQLQAACVCATAGCFQGAEAATPLCLLFVCRSLCVRRSVGWHGSSTCIIRACVAGGVVVGFAYESALREIQQFM